MARAGALPSVLRSYRLGDEVEVGEGVQLQEELVHQLLDRRVLGVLLLHRLLLWKQVAMRRGDRDTDTARPSPQDAEAAFVVLGAGLGCRARGTCTEPGQPVDAETWDAPTQSHTPGTSLRSELVTSPLKYLGGGSCPGQPMV